MKLLLDARALQPVLDGIGRYSAAVTAGLCRVRPAWEMKMLVSPGSSSNVHVASSSRLTVSESAVPRFRPGERHALSGVVRAAQPDALHNFSMAGPSWPGIPGCFTVHDLMVLELPGYFGPGRLRNALSRRWFGKLISGSIDRAAAVVTDSHWVGDRITARFPAAADKLKVIHPAQDLFDPARHTPRERQGFLLYVGNARAYKNLGRLFAAYRLASSRSSLPELVMVVRRDRAFASMEREIDRLGLRGRIRILSAVTEAELRDLYSTCLAFASPSICEGFGLPVLEAMAAGCPVLASRGTTLEEVAGDGALLVDPYSVEAIASGLEEICGSPVLRAALAEKALARASGFHWDVAAEAVARILEGIVAT